MNRKRIAAIFLASAIGVSLAACSPSEQPESALPNVTTTQYLPAVTGPSSGVTADTTRADATPDDTADAEWFTWIDEHGKDQTESLELAGNICNALNLGNTVEDLLFATLSAGAGKNVDYEAAGEFMALSILTFCPKYAGQVNDVVSKYSTE